MTQAQLHALLARAGFRDFRLAQTGNRFLPDLPQFQAARAASPWWVVFVPWGPVVIGWRKHDWCVDWRRARGTTPEAAALEGGTPRKGRSAHVPVDGLVDYLSDLNRRSSPPAA